jgi:hypothetical protein
MPSLYSDIHIKIFIGTAYFMVVCKTLIYMEARFFSIPLASFELEIPTRSFHRATRLLSFFPQ